MAHLIGFSNEDLAYYYSFQLQFRWGIRYVPGFCGFGTFQFWFHNTLRQLQPDHSPLTLYLSDWSFFFMRAYFILTGTTDLHRLWLHSWFSTLLHNSDDIYSVTSQHSVVLVTGFFRFGFSLTRWVNSGRCGVNSEYLVCCCLNFFWELVTAFSSFTGFTSMVSLRIFLTSTYTRLNGDYLEGYI